VGLLHGLKPIAGARSSIVAGLLLFSLAQVQAPAQATVPAAPPPSPQPAAGAPAPANGPISIDVEVTDKSGKPIRSLEAGDFSLLDNNQPTKLLDFHAIEAQGTTVNQVHVIIAVDAINTGVTVVAREREQLGEFLKQNGGELANPTSMAILSQRGIKVQQGATQDGKTILDSLDKTNSELRIEGRNTGFYGAADRITQSLGQLSQLAALEATRPGRKLVLFISAGWPLLAGAGSQEDMKQRTWVFNTIVDITNGLREAHVTLYTLDPFELGRSNPFYYQSYLKPVTKPGQAEYPDLALQVFSEHTGGLVQLTGNDIKGEINRALEDASAYYTLTFAPAPPGQSTEYHALRVQLDKPGLVVRTTAGYYVKGISAAEKPAR
jgi:VWFA-related protein